jgi:HK97 family phage prohead protease
MDWKVDIPHYGDRDDLVLEAISAAKQTMNENEARIVEVIATDALERGTTSIGELLDELEQLGVAGQRQLLDDARQQVGLDTTHEVERRREDAAFDRAWERLQPPPPPKWSPLQRCAECGAYPTTPEGAWVKVEVNRWWCDRHKHLAQPDDLQPYEPPYVGFTIKRWQESGKRLPLHWNHETGAESIIGAIDARSLRESEEGLYVKGQLDLEESEVARSAWRSMKNNAVSLSFGFLTVKSRDRADGVTELLELDLFEVSVVPHPANADTRFLDLKSATAGAETEDDDIDSLDLDQLRARSMAAIADIDLKRHRPITIVSFPC